MTSHHRHPPATAPSPARDAGVRAVDEATQLRVRDRVVELAESVAAAHQCELVSLEYRREPVGWVVRVFVERLGHDVRMPNGVTLEECALISRDLGTALDVADIVAHAYQLEVSSPGLERPIQKASDWARFAGLRAKVVVREPIATHPGHKAFRGEIVSSDGERVTFADDDLGQVVVPIAQIGRAHLLYEAPAKPKPGGKKKPHPKAHQELSDAGASARASSPEDTRGTPVASSSNQSARRPR